MNVFVTGASGWICSAVVAELIGAGHQSLDEGDSDPVRFLTYLVAALQTIWNLLDCVVLATATSHTTFVV